MKKLGRGIVARIVWMVFSVVIQLAAFGGMFLFFRQQFAWFYGVCLLLSVGATLYIIRQDSNPAFKLAWVIPILLFPIFGGLLYLMYGRVRHTRRERTQAQAVLERYREAIASRPTGRGDLQVANSEAALQSHYIESTATAPVYSGTSVSYFPLGEAMFADMCANLERAERFIFLEYFIIQPGKMWDTILEILTRKAKQGLDVRVLYDDLGCVALLPGNYPKQLAKRGIQCCTFNRFTNIFSSRFNNRDHRKICVIDGNVGYTGGINLADEYINAKVKHGHWKDTAVSLRGDAVWSMTAMFLSLWDCERGIVEPFALYVPTETVESDGFVQPFTDSPMDNEAVGETVYMNLLNRAHDYVYITTPYLIIDSEMITALCTAAKNGIDVRLITPGIPDKKLVYFLTQSYYEVLLRAGVRIYEYTPGFVHAKEFVCDDAFAVVGTINLDYRSLYLHYECAAWMYGSSAVRNIKQDFLDTQSKCRPITLDSMVRQSWFQHLKLSVLRLFAPLI